MATFHILSISLFTDDPASWVRVSSNHLTQHAALHVSMIKSATRNFFATLDLNVPSSNSASSVTHPELRRASQFFKFFNQVLWSISRGEPCYVKVLHGKSTTTVTGAKRLPAKALEACFQCSGSFSSSPCNKSTRRPKLLSICCIYILGLHEYHQKLPSSHQGVSPLSGSSPTLMPWQSVIPSKV